MLFGAGPRMEQYPICASVKSLGNTIVNSEENANDFQRTGDSYASHCVKFSRCLELSDVCLAEVVRNKKNDRQ